MATVRKKAIRRVRSPRDDTKISINGKELKRSDVEKIVFDPNKIKPQAGRRRVRRTKSPQLKIITNGQVRDLEESTDTTKIKKNKNESKTVTEKKKNNKEIDVKTKEIEAKALQTRTETVKKRLVTTSPKKIVSSDERKRAVHRRLVSTSPKQPVDIRIKSEKKSEQKQEGTVLKKKKKKKKKKTGKLNPPSKTPAFLLEGDKYKHKSHKPIIYDVPDFSELTPMEEKNIRIEYDQKFRTLQRELLGIKVRIPAADAPLEDVYLIYQKYLDLKGRNRAITQWKIILIVMLLVSEKVLTWIGLNASGFAAHQYNQMTEYESILIELGEEDIFNFSTDWPPFVKLLLAVGWNSLIFVVVRFFTKDRPGLEKMIHSMYNSLFGQTNQEQNSQENQTAQNENIGGFDISSMFGLFNGFVNGGNNAGNNRTDQAATPEPQGPVYNE